MVKHIRKRLDGKYTLMVTDAQGKPTSEILPAKFSPDDKFGSYRRIARKQLEQ